MPVGSRCNYGFNTAFNFIDFTRSFGFRFMVLRGSCLSNREIDHVLSACPGLLSFVPSPSKR